LEPEDPRAGLVVGYATPPDHAFSGALARLCAVLAAVQHNRRVPGGAQGVKPSVSMPG
jgi:hypothetical protein